MLTMTLELSNVPQAILAATDLVFLLFLPFQIRALLRSRLRNGTGWQGFTKTILPALLSVVLYFWWNGGVLQETRELWFSIITSGAASFGLSLLLNLQQHRAPHGSRIVTLYLTTSIICDAIFLGAAYGRPRHTDFLRPPMIRCTVHVFLLVIERCTKRSAADAKLSSKAPEELYGALDNVLFTWINPILYQGYRHNLISQNLPQLSHDMKPSLTREGMLRAWAQRSIPEKGNALRVALVRCVAKPFFAAIVPRLCLTFFRYCQPILIQQSISYVVADSKDTQRGWGSWLVLFAGFTYFGLALTTATYQHRLNKLKLVTSSALVGLIHEKVLSSPGATYDSGEVTTLMSNDAEGLATIGEMFHETWAQVVEVLIGIWLLAREVGWIWPLPLVLIYLCSHVSRFVAGHLKPYQKAWNEASQCRIGATGSMLSSIKMVKMLAFQPSLVRRITELRNGELESASKLRWVMVYYNASANALGIFSPAITLVIYAIITKARGEHLDTEAAFTTTAILSMVTHPANMVMTIVPRAIAALAGFDRIQSFLLKPQLQKNRVELLGDNISVREVTIGNDPAILSGVNIEIAAGSMTIISGPTGSGKTSLLRAIIGEEETSIGKIGVPSGQVAYCAQQPWLPNGTIQDAIYGFTGASNPDADSWYNAVKVACCLQHDFDILPDGDQTSIGSRGLNLSGGQRQRVAIARAVFAKCEILVLDDCFSGLDGETETAVFQNLFGPSGLISGAGVTVLLVSNSYQLFRYVDHVVVIGNGKIVDQGHWNAIGTEAASVVKFSAATFKEDVDKTPKPTSFAKLDAQMRIKDESEQDLARRTGDPALYGFYLSSIDKADLVCFVFSTAMYAFFITFPQYWLQMWTESKGKHTALYVSGYLLLSALSWGSTSVQMWSVIIRMAPQSGARLHLRLLKVVTGDVYLSAPLIYFSETDTGAILNRFSQDIQLVDKQLPAALQSVLTQVFKLLMQTILLCVTEIWLTISLPACMLVVYFIQKGYLRTSRQLRFLELESKAEVFSNFLESIEGVETIRAFGWSGAAVQANITAVDDAQRPEFLLLCLQRWLNIVLDLLSAAIAVGIVTTAIVFRGRVSGAQVGIALNIMLVANTTLLKLVENWTTLEASLGAIARLKTLESMTPSEGPEVWSLQPAENWPTKGHVEFRGITAAYSPDLIALRNVTLDVAAGQKLIICGRTGSGKSTVFLTLLRLLKLQSGKILIDGIDIQTVRLNLLRERAFIAVSQDPLILHNETLRFNLDPDLLATDSVVIDALSRSGLLPHFLAGGATASSTLHEKFSSFRELSSGQRQLFALCRALVKARALQLRIGALPVVILDEVTSSLDAATETAIYQILDSEFTNKGHTVIIITHRLAGLESYMVAGRDHVVVLADGRVREVIENVDPASFRRLGNTNL